MSVAFIDSEVVLALVAPRPFLALTGKAIGVMKAIEVRLGLLFFRQDS
jgi:hypothetical protein